MNLLLRTLVFSTSVALFLHILTQTSRRSSALAFTTTRSPRTTSTLHARKSAPPVVSITTREQLDAHWEEQQEDAIDTASVIGDTQIIGSPDHPDYIHPVVRLLHQRRRDGRRKNTAHCKIALAVEGGGMRGCVSAGMICAIHHLNLTHSLDAVYGSSAGTVVGSYMITEQLRFSGPQVYYDQLTTAGRGFINMRRILRVLGVGLLTPHLWKDVLWRRNAGKPVLDLDYLLKTTVQETKPLDWDTFVQRQEDLPMHVVASGLKSGRPYALSMKQGAFTTLDEFTKCMHASCLLPGIAGPVMNIHKNILRGEPVPEGEAKFILRNNLNDPQYEPFADSLLYEPLPFRTATEQDGYTHCVVVRSRPDGVDVTGKRASLPETLIAKRFFLRKNKLQHQYDRMMKLFLHKKAYADSILRLNEQAYSTRDPTETSKGPQLLSIALAPGSPEVGRLEVGREVIFDGIRRGFARAYDCLVEDPKLRGQGAIVAREYFPDEIMDYDPRHEDATSSLSIQEKSENESTTTPLAEVR